jgi:hypothetical protein
MSALYPLMVGLSIGFFLIVTGPIWQGALVLTAFVVLLGVWYVRLRGL